LGGEESCTALGMAERKTWPPQQVIIYDQSLKVGRSFEMGFPKECNACVEAMVNTHLFRGRLELALRPFKGAKPTVLLAGQDPTVAGRKIYSVLDLEDPNGLLYKYIVGDILAPTGVKLENIYATDLVKCRFPNNQTPKAISKDHGISIKEFLSPFFGNCRRWFLQEVREIQPKILLSFGEPVHQLLTEEFGWVVPTRMKDAFSNIYEVSLLGDNTLYAPCIHINSKGHIHYKNLWTRFIRNLKEAVISSAI
jgi:hypothetical protein